MSEKPVVAIETSDRSQFENQCQSFIEKGYRLESSSCSILNDVSHDFSSWWQAILVKVEQSSP